MYVDIKTAMDFGEAVKMLKKGEFVTNEDWIGPDGRPFVVLTFKSVKGMRPFIASVGFRGDCDIWSPSQRDMLEGRFFRVSQIVV